MGSKLSEKRLGEMKVKRSWTDDQVDRLKRFARTVAWLESNGNPKAVQANGPGRGKYQYEIKEGSGASSTARKRYENYYAKSKELPTEEENKFLKDSDPDLTNYSEDLQDCIFYVNHYMGKTPMNDVVSGKITFEDAWIAYHWSGDKAEVPAKKAMYQRRVAESKYKQYMGSEYV
jgi:hypothetical protein